VFYYHPSDDPIEFFLILFDDLCERRFLVFAILELENQFIIFRKIGHNIGKSPHKT
jgi:hypothetical protein